MSLGILTNTAANLTHRNLIANGSVVTAALAKLSAGSRVIAAKDDVAALSIGTRLRAEVAGLGQAAAMLQIADGALGRISDILVRMKTLTVEAGSGQLSNTERAYLNNVYVRLRSEIGRIAVDTEFNGQGLLAGGVGFIVGAIGENIEVADGLVGIKFGKDHDLTGGATTFRVRYRTDFDRFEVATESNAQYSDIVATAPAVGRPPTSISPNSI